MGNRQCGQDEVDARGRQSAAPPTPNNEAGTKLECSGEDKALQSLLTGQQVCFPPCQDQGGRSAEQEQGLSPREPGCMLPASKKTAHSMGTGKPGFRLWLWEAPTKSKFRAKGLQRNKEEGESSGTWPLLQPSLSNYTPSSPQRRDL